MPERRNEPNCTARQNPGGALHTCETRKEHGVVWVLLSCQGVWRSENDIAGLYDYRYREAPLCRHRACAAGRVWLEDTP